MDVGASHTNFIVTSYADRQTVSALETYASTGSTDNSNQTEEARESKDGAYSVTISDTAREKSQAAFEQNQRIEALRFNRAQQTEQAEFERQQQFEKAEFQRKQQLEKSTFRQKGVTA